MSVLLTWLRRRAGVRLRSAVAAAVVVAVALAVAATALVLLLDQSLRSSLDAEARQQAVQIARRLAADQRGDTENDALRVAGPGGGLVQVLDAAGTVLAASAPLAGQPPLIAARPAPGVTVSAPSTDAQVGDEARFEVAAVGVDTLGGPLVVLVGVPLEPVDRASDTALQLVLVGGPLLVLVAGLATYAFAGRALRPVEAIRTRVAELTEHRDLARRVPVPAARDEVGRLAETMNQMLGRLETAQAEQRRFVADASHELRSPLATLTAGLELAQRDGGLDGGGLPTLRAETARLAAMVDDLLLLARADERGLAPRWEEVDLDEVLDAERARLGNTSELRVEVRTVPVRVRGDRAQLGRAVRNLVDNAVRHAASVVRLRVWGEGYDAVLEVADDGPGIPPAERERIFGRFVRLDESRARSAGGAGLGLAIVHEVLVAHHGIVEVVEGEGAVFQLRLPAVQSVSR